MLINPEKAHTNTEIIRKVANVNLFKLKNLQEILARSENYQTLLRLSGAFQLFPKLSLWQVTNYVEKAHVKVYAVVKARTICQKIGTFFGFNISVLQFFHILLSL